LGLYTVLPILITKIAGGKKAGKQGIKDDSQGGGEERFFSQELQFGPLGVLKGRKRGRLSACGQRGGGKIYLGGEHDRREVIKGGKGRTPKNI